MIFVRDIQLAVADAFEINPAEMVSARRSQPQAFVRQIAMYLSRELTPYSLPTIGRLFGKRDHTTIMHGIKVVEKHMAENDEDREKIAAVQARILQDAMRSIAREVL